MERVINRRAINGYKMFAYNRKENMIPTVSHNGRQI